MTDDLRTLRYTSRTALTLAFETWSSSSHGIIVIRRVRWSREGDDDDDDDRKQKAPSRSSSSSVGGHKYFARIPLPPAAATLVLDSRARSPFSFLSYSPPHTHTFRLSAFRVSARAKLFVLRVLLTPRLPSPLVSFEYAHQCCAVAFFSASSFRRMTRATGVETKQKKKCIFI